MKNTKILLKDFKNLKKIWPYLKPWRFRLLLAVSLVPIIIVVNTAVPWILKETIDNGIAKNSHSAIVTGSLIYLILIISEYFFRGAQTLLLNTSVHKMIKSLRTALIQNILELAPAFHDRTLSGALVTRATSDFDNMSESLNQGILSSIIDLAVVLGTLFGLFILNPYICLSVILILPFVGSIVIFFSTTLKKTMLTARKKIAVLNAFIQECLLGKATIKILTAENVAAVEVGGKAKDYRNAQMKSVILDAFMFAILDGVASITIGLTLWVAVSPHINLNQYSNITPGILVATIAYIGNLFDPLKQLSNKIAMLQGTFTAIDRIFSILEEQDFISGDESICEIEGDIEFDSVSFSYSTAKPNTQIIDDLSFHVESKSSLAIVGPTGSGKSTIIKLITKMYQGFEGVILLDKKSIANISPRALRKKIGIVPQDIILFQGSISFNISLGMANISEDDIKNACKLVGADTFISQLPGKYQFQISEQGSNLSQGERQLISFARALAKKPSLIILDEATSSVDPNSEARIQKAIESILEERTVIIIAHRLSTIKNCDKILVLEAGKISQIGSHDDLISSKGTYQTLASHLN